MNLTKKGVFTSMTKDNEEMEITEAQKFLLNHECADLVISKHRKHEEFIYVSDIMEKFIYTRPKESEGVKEALGMIDKLEAEIEVGRLDFSF